jgi:mono/diheme cytochrome c family protein
MRERWAIALAVLTGLVVVVASAAFAAMQNPVPQPAPMVDSVATPQSATAQAETPVSGADRAPAVALDRGRTVYQANGCARCHQLAGEGSPRSPLDGVGGRLSRDELRQWVTADDAVADELSKRAWEAKVAYRAMPAEELEALLDYLASQR